MKKNLKILIWLLSIAGIALIILSAIATDHTLKLKLFFISGGLAIAVITCYALFKAKPSSFENKSNNP